MKSTTLKDLFAKPDIRFVIPEYQRAYTWGERQFSQFVEDLRECGKNYFLGHFLFEKSENTLYIIDGQQRLTTCVIFFSVLMNAIRHRQDESINAGNADDITSLLKNITDRYLKDNTSNRLKFTTVSYDNNFFIDAIIEYKESVHEEELTSKSRIAMRNARAYFENEMSKVSVPQMLSWADTLENASLTTFIVKDKLQAAQIFAYQNDRGKKLTNLEVLKAYFMLQLFRQGNDSDGTAYIENAFEEIYRNIVLITVDEDNVLNYYWKATGPKGYYSDNVVSEVKDWLKSVPQDKQTNQIKRFVNGLSRAFSIVRQIEQDNSFYTANLKCMNNMAYSYPMLIKARLSDVSDEVYMRLIRLMENLTFRILVRGGRADIKGRLHNVIQNAYDTESFDRQIDDVKQKLNNDMWWGYWSDAEMISHIKSGWFYRNPVDNYLLWRYEQYLCNDNYSIPKITYEDVISDKSIEHIAPQTQDSPLENGYGVYADKENPKEGIVSGEWMNSVGNLMLMAGRQNSSLGNRPFADKLRTYGTDNLLNQQKEIMEFVGDREHPVWDKSCIEKRFNKIVRAAKEIWSLDNI